MPSREQEARELAWKHYQVEDGLTQVFRVTGPGDAQGLPNEPIKFLEVNRNTVPSGIMPLGFGPAPASGVHFPSVILEVTPEEYHKIQTSEWTLPHGWMVGELIRRPEPEGGE